MAAQRGHCRIRAGTTALYGLTLTVLLSLDVAAGYAQTAEESGFRVVAFSFVALQVEDADVGSAWYERVFGLEEVSRSDAEDGRYSIRILSSASLTVELIELQGASAVEHPHLGLFKHGIYVDDVDAAFRWFRRQGVNTDPAIFTDDALQARSFVLRDLYGNRLQVVERCDEECPAGAPGAGALPEPIACEARRGDCAE